MKKWITGLFILLIVAIASIYIFIPSKLAVSAARMMNCTPNGTFRCLSEKTKWAQWFPSTVDTGDYVIKSSLVNTIHVTIHHDGDSINSIIYLFPYNVDSTGIQWKCEINTSNSPFNRIQRYQRAVAVKNDMDKILNSLRSFIEKPANVYGLPIVRTTFTDTILLATKTNTSVYPTTTEIYQQVNAIRTKITQQNATATGSPMVNITPLIPSGFEFMVAVPVNRVLPDSNPFFFRRMVPGAFMMAEVKGGPFAIKEALDKLQLYFYDYRKTAMAIPFETHITDRQAEPDSSKWITRIYAPVF
jgi:hypothetical protein